MNAQERFTQAHKHAVALGDQAYGRAEGLEQKADAYYQTYQREMAAFDQLEAMRKPLPNQAQIDAESVDLLKTTSSDHICPECGRATQIYRCPSCDWDGDYSIDA